MGSLMHDSIVAHGLNHSIITCRVPCSQNARGRERWVECECSARNRSWGRMIVTAADVVFALS